ncbi:MAG: FG-GAP-like repeat-containing protein, partial [Phycisphaerales bacterium]
MPRPIDSSAPGVRAVAAPAGLLAAVLLATPAMAQQFTQTTSTAFPSITLSEYSNAVDAADIDGDGDLDLVFANGGNFGSPGTPQVLRILINSGLNSGVFVDESVARTGGVTGRIRGVAIADIERDGDLDMLLSEDFLEQPRLLINDGTGVFTDETATRIPTGEISSTRAQFGDLDEDGDLDIYINAGGTSRFGCGQNRIWINDGNGVFSDQTNSRHPIGKVCEPMDVILGDLDGDFDLDVRTGNRGSNNSKVYLNRMGVLTESSN